MSGVRLVFPRTTVRVVRRLPLRALAIVLAAVSLGAAGWLWLRDSSLVAVREVVITGATSSEQPRVRAALRSAARGMTTLHVDESALRAAVAPYASVAGIRAEADFPHGLTIQVLERSPIAVAKAGTERIPITADGRLLRGVRASGDLPAITLRRASPPTTTSEPRALAALTILGAAPDALRARVTQARLTSSRGLSLELRDGPRLYFGNSSRPKAKWAAAARVLADSRASGALYLDLRVPERVGAGGVGPISADQQEVAATTNGQSAATQVAPGPESQP